MTENDEKSRHAITTVMTAAAMEMSRMLPSAEACPSAMDSRAEVCTPLTLPVMAASSSAKTSIRSLPSGAVP